MNLSVVLLFVLFVLRCGEQKFFQLRHKQRAATSESVRKEWRPEPCQGGQEVRGVFPLHSNLSEKPRSFVTTTDLFGPDAASPAFCSAVG